MQAMRNGPTIMILKAIKQRVCNHEPVASTFNWTPGDTPNDPITLVHCDKCGLKGTWSMLDKVQGYVPVWGTKEPFMRVGTKSVLFGVHQFILHPIFVMRAWWICYRSWPTLAEFCAIVSHDVGYWGMPNMDGDEGETHPERVASWWRRWFGSFGNEVAAIVIGHSRFHAAKNGLPLSKLFRPDKLATALYPKWLYLILANASGEIHEYMARCTDGKYTEVHHMENPTQTQWLIEIQAHMALMGLKGDKYGPVKKQMGLQPPEPEVVKPHVGHKTGLNYNIAEQMSKGERNDQE